MPRPRERLEVLEGKGRKHLTRAEKARRAAGEVRVEAPRQIRVPKSLPADLRQAYQDLGRTLRDSGLFTVLDEDVLVRYLLARKSYLEATAELLKLQQGGAGPDGQHQVDLEAVDTASRIQDRFFKQCQRCAGEMGLTMTSRCRLVLPQGAQPELENPLEKLLRERAERERA